MIHRITKSVDPEDGNTALICNSLNLIRRSVKLFN